MIKTLKAVIADNDELTLQFKADVRLEGFKPGSLYELSYSACCRSSGIAYMQSFGKEYFPVDRPELAIQAFNTRLASVYSPSIGLMTISDFGFNLQDILEPEDQIVRGLNSHGNNQDYLNGEEVCGECKCPYTNHGPSPIGFGMSCTKCRDEDMAYSLNELTLR